jgi:hypothetical protein
MSIITISPISTGIVALTQNNETPTVITINQGQQGPAGVSITVDNYGNNRITTSDGTPGGLYAESDLTFDGILRVSGIPVSISGHTHSASEISDISGVISSGIQNSLSSLSLISDVCDIDYVVVQDSGNTTKLTNISDLAKAISVIDGGGVSYSGC